MSTDKSRPHCSFKHTGNHHTVDARTDVQGGGDLFVPGRNSTASARYRTLALSVWATSQEIIRMSLYMS